MSGFHDVQFPTDISQGMRGGPQFRTTIMSSASGWEQRNQDWEKGRCRYEFGHILADDGMFATIVSFFRARKGAAFGFRFKDWSDYYVGMAWNNGVPNQLAYTGSAMQFATGDGATKTFALTKTYSDSAASDVRDITRPVAGTVAIYLMVGGVWVQQVSGWSVDCTTGLVTFTNAPSAGTAIGWAGQFDVPVRFEHDTMTITTTFASVGEWTGISVVEIRERDSS